MDTNNWRFLDLQCSRVFGSIIRPLDVSREGLKFYPWTFFFLSFFYQSTVLSSHAGDGHQIYFGGSIVVKASTIGIGISPTRPLILTGGKKVRNLASFKTSLNFEPPALENPARCPNSETKVQYCDDRRMSWPSLVKLGSRTPEKALSVLTHPVKLHAKTR